MSRGSRRGAELYPEGVQQGGQGGGAGGGGTGEEDADGEAEINTLDLAQDGAGRGWGGGDDGDDRRAEAVLDGVAQRLHAPDLDVAGRVRAVLLEDALD